MHFLKAISLVALVSISVLSPSVARADQSCSPFVREYVSNSSIVAEGIGNAAPTTISPLWVPAFAGSFWIWGSALVTEPNNAQTQTFILTFTLPGDISSSTLTVGADDYVAIWVNGTQIASEMGDGNFFETNLHTYQTPALFRTGENTVIFAVTNAAYFYSGLGTPQNNPAGLLFKLGLEGEECVTTGGSSRHSGGGQAVAPTAAGDTSSGNGQQPHASNTEADSNTGGVVAGAFTQNEPATTTPVFPGNRSVLQPASSGTDRLLSCAITALWTIVIVMLIEHILAKFLAGNKGNRRQHFTLRTAVRILFLIIGMAALWYAGEICALPIFAIAAICWIAASAFRASKPSA